MLAHIVRRAYTLPLTTALLAAITAGCTDRNHPTAPDDAETTEASAVARGDRYIVLLKEEGQSRLRANTLGTEVARLGGRIERAHNEIGVLQVRNLTAAARSLGIGRATFYRWWREAGMGGEEVSAP